MADIPKSLHFRNFPVGRYLTPVRLIGKQKDLKESPAIPPKVGLPGRHSGCDVTSFPQKLTSRYRRKKIIDSVQKRGREFVKSIDGVMSIYFSGTPFHRGKTLTIHGISATYILAQYLLYLPVEFIEGPTYWQTPAGLLPEFLA